ncbi:TrmB family transcriptional regulator [Priestia megaterium]|nr:TrmB family transcriptional regulator [Priestia megaterium]
MEAIIEQLQSLGFNQYESKVYVTLVKKGASTAYQISKYSGVPRARVYDILTTLEEKGIVLKEEINEATQYTPLPVDAFLHSLRTKWQRTYEDVSETLRRYEHMEPMTESRVMTMKGADAIVAFCQSLIVKAKKKVVVSLWNDMYERLEETLITVQDRCDLKGIVFEVDSPIQAFDRHRHTSYTANIGEQKWFILSIDGKEMIYGQLEVAYYTDNPVHINLLENYIWHDILVNRLVEKSEADMDSWIEKARDQFFS